ncbi:MAG: DevR family CRISPR-associated autoregulator [Actinomycetota bacterium]|nr:DevR family CRISPR-associated autoregulator [Actinomycetota bacterium]
MKLNSLAISGLVTIDLHALNNEGSEGNTMMTRMVEIVDSNGKLATVNAISGDMFKHIQAEHLFRIATEEDLTLCSACRVFDANRICADKSFTDSFDRSTQDSLVLADALRRCILDDCEGILITNNNKSIARKSCIEFGWLVGRPETTRTEAYFHAKYVPEGRGAGSGAGENLGQNIFHRPASSGQYAAVANVDLYKVGRNDITLNYDIEPEERLNRAKALLKSALYAFIKPTGAHRNTQNPHVVDFSGVVTTSTSTVPAPLVSALNPMFADEITGISDSLNTLAPGAISVLKFSGLQEFAAAMSSIIIELEG